MLKLDDSTLAAVGLSGLPQELRSRVLRRTYEVLELRVGTRLAKAMTDEQVTEFEGLMEIDDGAAAFAWLERAVPDYKVVVREEHEVVLRRLRGGGPRLLAAAGASDAEL